MFTSEQYDENIRMLCSAEAHIRLLQEKKQAGQWSKEDAELFDQMKKSREVFIHNVSVIRPFFPSSVRQYYDLPFEMDPGIDFTASYYPRDPFHLVRSGDHYITVSTGINDLPEHLNGWDSLRCLLRDTDCPAAQKFHRDNYVLYTSPSAWKNSPDGRLTFQYLYQWETGSAFRPVYTDHVKEEEVVRYVAEYENEPVHDYWKEKEDEAVRKLDSMEDWFEKYNNKDDYNEYMTDQQRYEQGYSNDSYAYWNNRFDREDKREEVRRKIREKARYSDIPLGTTTGGGRRLVGYKTIREPVQVHTKEKHLVPASSICYTKRAVIGACNGCLATIFIPRKAENRRTRVLVNHGSFLMPAGDIVYQQNDLPPLAPDMNTLLFKLGRMFGQFLGDYDKMEENASGLPDEHWRIWNEGVWAALNDPGNR